MDHKSRMREIGRFVLPDENTPAREELDAWIAKQGHDPDLEDFAKEAWELAHTLIIVQQENGAGLALDEAIRYFHADYNNRIIRYGLNTMPASFNVVEALLEYVAPLSIFAIRKEVDHIFSLDSFLNYVTSDASPSSATEAAKLLPQGIIHSYLNSDQPISFTFSTNAGKEFGVGGCSLVRHGDEVSVLLLAGELYDPLAVTETIESPFVAGTPKGKEGIKPDPSWTREAVPLFEDSRLWRAIALARLDLRCETLEVRYILHDQGDSFRVTTDDAAVFFDAHGQPVLPGAEKAAQHSAQAVQDYQVLFEVCKTFLYLPLFFDEHEEEVNVERHRTKYGQLPRAERRRNKDRWPAEERIHERHVHVLSREMPTSSVDRISFLAPAFRVEGSGYWKKLSHGQVGADKRGQPVHGKTWVEKRLSWHEGDASSSPMPTTATAGGTNRKSGWIYVLRSAMHPKDVFKIGHTTRDPGTRADEISRGSGVPDRFFTVYEWAVADSSLVERIVHERLGAYRLANSREFFQVPLKEIVRTVEAVIGERDMTSPTV